VALSGPRPEVAAGGEPAAPDDRRHAARVALALVLLAPFVLVGVYAVLVDRADDPPALAAPLGADAGSPGSVSSSASSSGSSAAGSSGRPATTSTALGTGVTNMTSLAAWQVQYLACVRQVESRNTYTAVNPSRAGGAYQIMPVTWNNTAQHIGRTDLVGVSPQYASPADQDLIAGALLEWQGPSAWSDGCG
jgi:soluble lytic murein transglycosylase-like protein